MTPASNWPNGWHSSLNRAAALDSIAARRTYANVGWASPTTRGVDNVLRVGDAHSTNSAETLLETQTKKSPGDKGRESGADNKSRIWVGISPLREEERVGLASMYT